MIKTVIVVPSRERADVLPHKKKHTLAYVQHSTLPVYVVVRECEFEAYRPIANAYGAHLIFLPDSVDRIAKTYDAVTHHLQRNGIEQAIFMDDDLTFAVRPDFSTAKLEALPLVDIDIVIGELCHELNRPNVAMAGLAHRRGAQGHKVPYKWNQKLIAVLACNLNMIGDRAWNWEADSMFDHHMVLSMLEAGYDNVQICKYTHDDVLPRHAQGGCTAYRDIDVHSRAAEALAGKFPDVVSLREKWLSDHNRYGLDVTMHMKQRYGHRHEADPS